MKFGIEIELISPLTRAKLAAALRREKISTIATYSDGRTSRRWRLVDDGSISCGEDNGVEVVSPILRYRKDFVRLKRVIDVLQKLGCNVDNRCGLHVHVDVSTLNFLQKVQVGLKYKYFENDIQRWIKDCREENGYCEASADAEELREWMTECTYDKDRKINVGRTLMANYKTIEFRHHHGTLNYYEIRNWITFCCEFVKAAAKEVKPMNIAGMSKVEKDALKLLLKNGSIAQPQLPSRDFHDDDDDGDEYYERVRKQLKVTYPKLHPKIDLATTFWGTSKPFLKIPNNLAWKNTALWTGIPKQTRTYFENVANVRSLLEGE